MRGAKGWFIVVAILGAFAAAAAIVVPRVLQPEVDRLRKENRRLQRRLQRAELIIDIQKKISQMLGIPLKNPELGEDD